MFVSQLTKAQLEDCIDYHYRAATGFLDGADRKEQSANMNEQLACEDRHPRSKDAKLAEASKLRRQAVEDRQRADASVDTARSLEEELEARYGVQNSLF